jgi:serine/threonine protein kinase
MNPIIEQKISSGSFGIVFKISNVTGKKMKSFAMKMIPHKRGCIQNLLELVLHFTPCEYIINCLSYEIDKTCYKIIMPLANTDIYKLVNSNNNLGITNLKNMMFEIALSIKYLHDIKVVHGDIKPSNILIFKHKNTYKAKLTDFSFSGLCLNSRIYNQKAYTINYKAPEIELLGSYNFKADIWALGQTFKRINFRDCSSEFEDLINNMLKINEDERWNINQVLNSDFFKNISNSKIKNVTNQILSNKETFLSHINNHFDNVEIIDSIVEKMTRIKIIEDENFIIKEISLTQKIIEYFKHHILIN